MKIIREEFIGPHHLIQADCRDVLPYLRGAIDAVVSDPPYPNAQGHFVEGIETARWVLSNFSAPHWLWFWTEVEMPRSSCAPVAVHIWHRTNTNRPDNYEPIFEYHEDGKKRASRVLPHCVIFPGLTGVEASGHPTEKNVQLMMDLVKRTRGVVLDPFMGSGTTGVACAKLGRDFVGIELRDDYFEIAVRRIDTAMKQLDMFVGDAAPAAKQEAFAL